MIQYNPKEWFGLIFKFHKSDTFRKLWLVLLSVSLFALALAYIEIEILQLNFKSTAVLHSVLGFVLSILLVFRTNTAYDRWWEGRRLWGSLVNDARNLSIKLSAEPKLSKHPQYEEIIQWIIIYPRALAAHLRNQTFQVAGLPEAGHQPMYIIGKMNACMERFVADGAISETRLLKPYLRV